MTTLRGASFEKEYFEKYYSDYDLQNPSGKLVFYRALVEDALAGTENPAVLEIGCAFGKFLSSLNPAWRRSGMDISEFAIERARKKVPDAALSVAGLPDIPFKGSFDLIAAFDVLEHVPDLEKAIASIKSRLTPSGRFIFVVPVYDGPTGPLIHLLDRDPTHIHKKSRRFWLELAGTHFQIDTWLGIYRYMSPFGYLHKPTKLLRQCTPAIAVVAHAGQGPEHVEG